MLSGGAKLPKLARSLGETKNEFERAAVGEADRSTLDEAAEVVENTQAWRSIRSRRGRDASGD